MSNPPVVSNAHAASLDLAMIGNCAVSALVDARARVVWCCMPRFDSTPVFDALMQSANGVPESGAMALEIEGLARSEQSYDHGTAILRTRLWDGQGQCVEVVDFAPRFITRDRVFRPAQLVRRIGDEFVQRIDHPFERCYADSLVHSRQHALYPVRGNRVMDVCQ